MKKLRNLKSVKEKGSEVNADISEQNCFNPTISSSPKVQNTILNNDMKKDKEQKSEMKEDLYSCSMCEYKAKKKQLKKSILSLNTKIMCARNAMISYHLSWSY